MLDEAKAKLILSNLNRVTNLTSTTFELDCADFKCIDCVFGRAGACYITTSNSTKVFSIVYSYIEQHHPELLI